ncbi:S8 family serine peptidase [Candidatus Acetothermia bacterium]|nr:S8 family serine peptidase [Candidatus Acetothermia bacterium]
MRTKLSLLVIALIFYLFSAGAAQPALSPCPPAPARTLLPGGSGEGQQSTSFLQLTIQQKAKGLGPCRVGQELTLNAVVASLGAIDPDQVQFLIDGAPFRNRRFTSRGPVSTVGPQLLGIQDSWTATPSENISHEISACLSLSPNPPPLCSTSTIDVLRIELREGVDFAPGILLVKFKPGVSSGAIQETIRRLNTTQISFIAFIEVYVLRITDAQSVLQKIDAFRRDSNVQYAEPDGYWYAQQQIPNDPQFSKQWNLRNLPTEHPCTRNDITDVLWNTFSPPFLDCNQKGKEKADIRAMDLWGQFSNNQFSQAVTAAVLDSGIAIHPDLEANVIRTESKIFIDPKLNAPEDQDTNIYDTYGHGTFVASIMAALGNNGLGLTGILFNTKAKVWPLKVSKSGKLLWTDFANAIAYVLTQKTPANIRVINLSYGGMRSESLSNALDRVKEAGLLFITSAGNYKQDLDQKPFYPCSYERENKNENILCVAASDDKDQLWSESSFGAKSVDLVAPGVDILGLIPEGLSLPAGRKSADSSSIFVGSGTSFAAPHVTAVVASLWARCPTASATVIRRILLDGVEKLHLQAQVASGGRLRWPEKVSCN